MGVGISSSPPTKLAKERFLAPSPCFPVITGKKDIDEQ